MPSPNQLPAQVGDTTNLLLKKLVTATQDLGTGGGVFLTEAEADALFFRLDGGNSPLESANGVVRSNTGWATAPQTTAYAASTDIDLRENLQTVTLAGDITFTTSNKSAGLYTTVRVVGDGSNRALTFPGAWVWVGSVAPTTLVANEVGLLSLVCFGAADSDVVASWVSSL